MEKNGYWSKQFAKDENGKTLIFLHLALDSQNKFTGEVITCIPPYMFLQTEIEKSMDKLRGTNDRNLIDAIGAEILNYVLGKPELVDIILLEKYLNKHGDVNIDLYEDVDMETNSYTVNEAYTIHENTSAFDDLKQIIYHKLGFPWSDKSKSDRSYFESFLSSDSNKSSYAEIFETGLEYHVINTSNEGTKKYVIWAGKDCQMLMVMFCHVD